MEAGVNEFVDWLNFGWAVLVAIPGIIAFVWTRNDRADRRKAEGPYGEWSFFHGPDSHGWYETEISIKNRWDEPLYGRSVRIKGLLGTRIGFPHLSPDGSVSIIDKGTSAAVSWKFWTSTRTGEGPSSGATTLYVRPSKWMRLLSAQSGTTFVEARMSKLRLEVDLISASNRKTLCVAKQRWTNKPSRAARRTMAASSK
ncbi:hypothetical protein GOC76_19155 [Sinorhizobium medicae]|nr:hypothetical protein [Sinorhizobium medicae]